MRITFESKEEILHVADLLRNAPGEVLMRLEDLLTALEEYPELPWEDSLCIPVTFTGDTRLNRRNVLVEGDEDVFTPTKEAQYTCLAGKLDACFRMQGVYPVQLQEVSRISGLELDQLLFLWEMWTQHVYCREGSLCG